MIAVIIQYSLVLKMHLRKVDTIQLDRAYYIIFLPDLQAKCVRCSVAQPFFFCCKYKAVCAAERGKI